ncbi:hypothetical protein [Legionella feeleii]|uniref:Uncharacterized protein n=1 Tax=Legionella feeleii TaxID=453 RepID=A0A0W0TKE0_9GAMM|nr:hypothetical protein [Legionella feeleii]KTC96008.1 hypothetical protein Lfee_2370 [Legionella feeleii]SPX60230.1 Uncharacterised protein [Legionella feeleii]
MKNGLREWSKKAVLALLVIVILVLSFNVLLSYLVTDLIYSYTSKGSEGREKNPEFNLQVNLVPYFKIDVDHFAYRYKGKVIISFRKASAHLSLLALLKQQLRIYDLELKKGFINLVSLPKIAEEEKQAVGVNTREKKELSDSQSILIDRARLSHIDMVYSLSDLLPPLHFKTIKIVRMTKAPYSVFIETRGDLQGKRFNASAVLNTINKEQLINAELFVAQNKFSFHAKYADNTLVSDISGKIVNSKIIEKLFAIQPDQLPTEFNAKFSATDKRIAISPIQITFLSGLVRADISQIGSDPIIMKVSFPQSFLKDLEEAENFRTCPLPMLLVTIVKDLKLHATVQITAEDAVGSAAAQQTTVIIDGQGIHFDNDFLPRVLKQGLHLCFDKFPNNNSMSVP